MSMEDKDTHIDLAPDLKVSRIITGLWQIADMERDDKVLDLDRTACSMKAYSQAGLTTFDMADHYGSAEKIAGIFTNRYADGDDVQVLTKWVPKPGGSSKEVVLEAVDRARHRLQTDQLDLLQYHAWNYADPSYLDELFWLQELQDEGLIKHLGVTNFDTIHLNIILQKRASRSSPTRCVIRSSTSASPTAWTSSARNTASRSWPSARWRGDS